MLKSFLRIFFRTDSSSISNCNYFTLHRLSSSFSRVLCVFVFSLSQFHPVLSQFVLCVCVLFELFLGGGEGY